MKKWIAIAVVVLIIISGGVWFTNNQKPKGESVKVKESKVTKIQSYISTSGVVESKDKKLYFGEQGTVDDIKVDVGDSVYNGQRLMTIKTAMGTKSIKSEIDGVVTEINLSEGQMNSLAQPAVVVQDTDDLKVAVQLSKYDAPSVKKNQSVKIMYNGITYKGKVTSIDPTADVSKTNTSNEVYQYAYISIKDPKDLIIGFNVDVDILVESKDDALTIPIEALVSNDNNKDYVYVAKNNKSVKKQVEIGIMSDTKVEILSGLSKGEKVILNPSSTINNGTAIVVSK